MVARLVSARSVLGHGGKTSQAAADRWADLLGSDTRHPEARDRLLALAHSDPAAAIGTILEVVTGPEHSRLGRLRGLNLLAEMNADVELERLAREAASEEVRSRSGSLLQQLRGGQSVRF